MDTCADTPLQTARPPMSPAPRRALATRSARWARALARGLARLGVRPDTVSVAGLVCAAGASLAFIAAPELAPGYRSVLLLGAAAGIQLRLLCNLLDGMLAVEEGLKSTSGDIYNELPDRLADVFILVGAGCSARDLAYGTTLGWAAAVLALFTAYVRVLAGSLGLTQHFTGPMAKQHRMFVLTLATAGSIVETLLDLPPRVMPIGLIVIVAGSIVTAVRRVRDMVREANAR